MFLCVCAHVAGEQIRKRRCKAAFSYVPQHEDELELKIGDIIEIISEVRRSTNAYEATSCMAAAPPPHGAPGLFAQRQKSFMMLNRQSR